MPRTLKRPSASVSAGVGPGRQIFRVTQPHECGAFEASSSGSPSGSRTRRPMRFDRDPDAPDGPAVDIEKTPLDHLFGSKRDVGGGLIGVGVQIDPADAVAGRDGDGDGFLMCR